MHKITGQLRRLLPRVVPTMLVVPACIAQNQPAPTGQQLVRPYAGLSATYDSNVLGLSNTAAAIALTNSPSMSDTSRIAFAGIDLQKTLGRQVLAAKLNASQARFDRLTRLDYDGYDLSADWIGELGNGWDGKLGYSRTFTLAPFTNFHGMERNTLTVEREFANAGWKVHPNWRLRAGASHYAVAYDLPLQKRYDRTERQSELGVDYLTRRSNLLSLQWRRTDGRFQHQLGEQGPEFRQDQLDIKLHWLVGGKTSIGFLGGRVARKHPGSAERDFHGYNGRLNVKFTHSDKSAFSAGIWRETGIFDDASTSYSTNLGASFSGRWAVTGKTGLEASWTRERRDFTRPSTMAALPAFDDTLNTAQLALQHVAGNHLEFQLTLISASKETSTGFGEYKRRAASASARYRF